MRKLASQPQIQGLLSVETTISPEIASRILLQTLKDDNHESVSDAREAMMVNRDGSSHVLGAMLLSISPASTFCWLEGSRSRETLEA